MLAGLLLGLSLVGCNAQVAGGLEEADANQALSKLQEHGVVARKEPDPDAEGHFRLSVSSDEATTTAQILAQAGFPHRRPPGVLEALGEGSIIPSRETERAKWLAGIAGELERSLSGLGGVLTVRVHLAVPVVDALDVPKAAPARPTASVLLTSRGELPLSESQIQRLVAGAVTGLAPGDVTVISRQSAAEKPPPRLELRQLGPITVTRSSAPLLKVIVGGALTLNLLLLASTLWLWQSTRRKFHSIPEPDTSPIPTQA